MPPVALGKSNFGFIFQFSSYGEIFRLNQNKHFSCLRAYKTSIRNMQKLAKTQNFLTFTYIFAPKVKPSTPDEGSCRFAKRMPPLVLPSCRKLPLLQKLRNEPLLKVTLKVKHRAD